MSESDYQELRSRLKAEGLFERNWVPYMASFFFMVLLLFVAIAIMFWTQNIWLVLLNACLITLIYGRFGLLAHDFGHMQVFKSTKWNNFFGHISGAIVGLSYSWWNDKHNAHHAHTNFEDCDPDIEIPILAYSENQAQSKKGIARWIVKYQAWFFFPIQLLSYISLRSSSIMFTLREYKRSDFALNLLLASLHAAIYLGVVFATQKWWVAIIFIIFHQKLWSAYITSIFAPNHKGMPILEGQSVDFLREQIMTARNIRPNIFTNYYYGHLNLQIEHHLFPTMPRHNYMQARKIIKEFCEEKGIYYHETSVIGSYIEIIKHMHEVSMCLR